MAAIGVGITSRDVVHGWEAIMPEQISALEREYRLAKRKYNEAEFDYTRAVDYWQSCRERGFTDDLVDMAFRAMADAEYRMDEAEIEKRQAYKRLSCPHTHIKVDTDLPDGMAAHVCLMCGAVV